MADGDQLYTGVKALVAEHLDQLAVEAIVPAFPRSSGTHGAGKLGGGAEAVERAMEGDQFLKAVKNVWEDHTGSMRKLKDVLKYMVSRVRRVCLMISGQGVYSLCRSTNDIRRRSSALPSTYHPL